MSIWKLRLVFVFPFDGRIMTSCILITIQRNPKTWADWLTDSIESEMTFVAKKIMKRKATAVCLRYCKIVEFKFFNISSSSNNLIMNDLWLYWRDLCNNCYLVHFGCGLGCFSFLPLIECLTNWIDMSSYDSRVSRLKALSLPCTFN